MVENPRNILETYLFIRIFKGLSGYVTPRVVALQLCDSWFEEFSSNVKPFCLLNSFTPSGYEIPWSINSHPFPCSRVSHRSHTIDTYLFGLMYVSRTGSQEEYTEKDQLLTERTDLYNEKGNAQEKSAEAAAKNRELAVKLRDDACNTLGEKKDVKQESTSSNRRASGSFLQPITDYMASKEKQQKESDEKKIDLERERLQFERSRFEEEAAMRREEQTNVRLERERREKAEDDERKLRHEREKEEREARREERQQAREHHQLMMTFM